MSQYKLRLTHDELTALQAVIPRISSLQAKTKLAYDVWVVLESVADHANMTEYLQADVIGITPKNEPFAHTQGYDTHHDAVVCIIQRASPTQAEIEALSALALSLSDEDSGEALGVLLTTDTGDWLQDLCESIGNVVLYWVDKIE